MRLTIGNGQQKPPRFDLSRNVAAPVPSSGDGAGTRGASLTVIRIPRLCRALNSRALQIG